MTITSKDIFKNEKKVLVKAIFAEKALAEILNYYDASKLSGMHDLPQDEFLGWIAAVGVMSIVTGEREKTKLQKENEELKLRLKGVV
jgi:hypothetical protein